MQLHYSVQYVDVLYVSMFESPPISLFTMHNGDEYNELYAVYNNV